MHCLSVKKTAEDALCVEHKPAQIFIEALRKAKTGQLRYVEVLTTEEYLHVSCMRYCATVIE